jgi:hypothetical protein
MIVFPFFRGEKRARPELLDELFIGGPEGSFGGCRLDPGFDHLKDIEQNVGGAPNPLGPTGDELRDDRLALGDLLAPAVFGDDYRFVQRRVQRERRSRSAGIIIRRQGGKLMISRWIRPSRTSFSLAAMTLKCQLSRSWCAD